MILMKRPSPPSPTAPPIPWIRISHVGDVPPGQSGPIPGLRTARRSRVDRKDTPLSRVYSSYLGPFFSGTVRVTAAVFVMIRAGRVVSHYSLSIALRLRRLEKPGTSYGLPGLAAIRTARCAPSQADKRLHPQPPEDTPDGSPELWRSKKGDIECILPVPGGRICAFHSPAQVIA